ncbi:hypothetical protein HUG20_12760 [Salicibibacter cibi]|uniref:Uncharacterized protein n=1 Tax=Salicibibacter cibi TaxID=2743001 RepID=A0A7T6ZCA1_9BACI|nr:hypothetical protein [Salicibibacter cibi]QQK80682.1 hypothetical protein HUG20_12760 [Salicibibacter cibi]
MFPETILSTNPACVKADKFLGFEAQVIRQNKSWSHSMGEGMPAHPHMDEYVTGDLHEFIVRDANGLILAVIRPEHMEDQSQLIDHLNNGKSVVGWKDSKGNTIFMSIGEEAKSEKNYWYSLTKKEHGK